MLRQSTQNMRCDLTAVHRYLHLKDYGNAHKLLEPFIGRIPKHNPGYIHIYLAWAQLRLLEKNDSSVYEDLIALYKEKNIPNLKTVCFSYGGALHTKKNFNNAILIYNKILGYDPRNPKALLCRVEALNRLGHYDTSLKLLNAAWKHFSDKTDKAKAYNIQAVAYYNLLDKEKALDAIFNAQKEDPTYKGWYSLLPKIITGWGKADNPTKLAKAQKLYEEAYRAKPSRLMINHAPAEPVLSIILSIPETDILPTPTEHKSAEYKSPEQKSSPLTVANNHMYEQKTLPTVTKNSKHVPKESHQTELTRVSVGITMSGNFKYKSLPGFQPKTSSKKHSSSVIHQHLNTKARTGKRSTTNSTPVITPVLVQPQSPIQTKPPVQQISAMQHLRQVAKQIRATSYNMLATSVGTVSATAYGAFFSCCCKSRPKTPTATTRMLKKKQEAAKTNSGLRRR